jgi:glyoxylase-like metal-dependent hydrolase (beta-lactamase superfamily II)
MTPKQIAPHVFQINLGFVNAYAITTIEGDWVLVDTGLKPTISLLKSVEAFFKKAPLAIVLTHGHMDHAGGARALAKAWNCKIYVHRLEKPFLNGLAIYPPKDPSVGGALAQISRLTPWPMFNLTGLLELIPENGHLEFLAGWKVIETPGHTAGHISLWNEENGTLIAGDALATMDTDSYLDMVTMRQKLSVAGTPFISDWAAAKHSVGILADLEPAIVAAGHGKPMIGDDLPEKMRQFYAEFKAPEHGRYAQTPAKSDEKGMVSTPVEPPDDFVRNLSIFVAVAGILALVAKLLRRR